MSPALPIGAFAYAQALEAAIDARWVRDEATATAWIGGILAHGIGRLEVPLFGRLHRAWLLEDGWAIKRWNAFLLATRGSEALRTEDEALGSALAVVLDELGLVEAQPFLGDRRGGAPAYLTMVALAAARWSIPVEVAATGLVFAWSEHQAGVAKRSVSLPVSADQRILMALEPRIELAVKHGLGLADERIGFSAPAHVMASAYHETQHTRLFRS